jgi:aspartyl-tRNA(Asn)/glutamyl-tRNA(Gln) amidotransferase subunit A
VRLNRNEPMFITLLTERAELEAAASSARYREGAPLGPLDGVPIGWKDLFDIAGTMSSSGSVVRSDMAVEDAVALQALTAQGCVAVGKTNMSEFAFSTLGLNPHFGTPANARDEQTRRAPGGSSSGAGVAVARDCVPIAMGSDTGGSIRIPASLNGIVGFKPSHGRYDMRGTFPLAQSMDTIGPLARSVEDCILIDQALRGVAAGDAVEAPSLKGRRFVVAPDVLENAEPDIAHNFERTLEAIGRAGAKIERREILVLREIDEVQKRHGNLILIEAYDNLREFAEGPEAEKMDRRVRERVSTGKGRSADDLAALRDAQDRISAALSDNLKGAFLIAPTVIIAPPAIDELEADDAFFLRTNLAMRQNTAPGNFLKLPSLSLPNGVDGAGLPTGLMLSAARDDDDGLLMLALAVEALLSKSAG